MACSLPTTCIQRVYLHNSDVFLQENIIAIRWSNHKWAEEIWICMYISYSFKVKWQWQFNHSSGNSMTYTSYRNKFYYPNRPISWTWATHGNGYAMFDENSNPQMSWVLFGGGNSSDILNGLKCNVIRQRTLYENRGCYQSLQQLSCRINKWINTMSIYVSFGNYVTFYFIAIYQHLSQWLHFLWATE